MKVNGPKYPGINVKLVGEDGNAFFILGRVHQALKRGGVPKEEMEKFYKEATSGDYNTLLRTVMDWVNIDGEDKNE